MNKRSIFTAAICALAIGAAGCGGDDDEDNKALSYDETGERISAICDSVTDPKLTGDAKKDAPALEASTAEFEDAIAEVEALEVNEELTKDRDAFVDNAREQLELIAELQKAADSGDDAEFQRVAEDLNAEGSSIDTEGDLIASRLGATGCIEDGE